MKCILILLFIFISCSKSPSTKVATNALVDRGKAVYQAYCTQCHNINPKITGVLGPDIFGSSRELLETRVLNGSYPAGYTPKRLTKIMVPMPSLKSDLDALYTYLNGK